ncbi:MAG: GGDEF domain-containing protein [Acidimicrobiia bacterium]
MADDDTLTQQLSQRIAELEEEVRRLSLSDELTGISNRRGFLVRAEQARLLVRRRREPSVVLFVDIDGLGRINDGIGREYGDQFLREAADVLTNAFRECDVVARWGGDEFVAFLPGAINAAPARRRLEERIDRTNRHRPARPLRISIGSAAMTPADTRPFVEVIAEAATAMNAERRYQRTSGNAPTP